VRRCKVPGRVPAGLLQCSSMIEQNAVVQGEDDLAKRYLWLWIYFQVLLSVVYSTVEYGTFCFLLWHSVFCVLQLILLPCPKYPTPSPTSINSESDQLVGYLKR
jgi:hypothetical protein